MLTASALRTEGTTSSFTLQCCLQCFLVLLVLPCTIHHLLWQHWYLAVMMVDQTASIFHFYMCSPASLSSSPSVLGPCTCCAVYTFPLVYTFYSPLLHHLMCWLFDSNNLVRMNASCRHDCPHVSATRTYATRTKQTVWYCCLAVEWLMQLLRHGLACALQNKSCQPTCQLVTAQRAVLPGP